MRGDKKSFYRRRYDEIMNNFILFWNPIKRLKMIIFLKLFDRDLL